MRGTVRSIEKNAWLQEYFDTKYKPGLLELVHVEDFTKEDCFNDVVKGGLGTWAHPVKKCMMRNMKQ